MTHIYLPIILQIYWLAKGGNVNKIHIKSERQLLILHLFYR